MAAPITNALLDIAALSGREVLGDVKELARLSLFDWMVVSHAGVDEPVSRILREFIQAEGGAPVATLIGGGKAPARAAALVNGATSHALDYDDTHFGHVGHLSVAIMPAALAAAEEEGASLGRLLTAFTLGAEAACRFGAALGRAHYVRGFHQTATSGAVGAAVAAGRIYGLSAEEMRNALSLIGTRASGLISQFGTMGKPYNAGIAASNGIEAAQLARRGFVAADDGLAGPQGFLATCSDAPEVDAALQEPPPRKFLFAANKFKLHACCHGLHAMIEGLQGALERGNITSGEIEGIRIRTNPRWLNVCDIKAPRSGLEVKFSYAWLAGMVAHGVDTADRNSYSDAAANDALLHAFAERVIVESAPELSDTQAEGRIRMMDGGETPFAHDLDEPVPIDALRARLNRKAIALLGVDEADRIQRAVTQPDDAPTNRLLAN